MRSWNIKTYNTNSLLKKEVITDVLDLFWEECIQTIESNESIVLVIRFQKNNKQFNTISVLQVNTNKETLINSIEEKSIPFYNTYVSNIEISYNVKSGEINPAWSSNSSNSHVYYHYKLPITMNPLEYGDLIRTYDNIYISQLGLHNLLVITVDGNTNHVELYKNGRKIFDWIDTKVSDNKFIRYIGNSEYIFVDNSLKQVTKNL